MSKTLTHEDYLKKLNNKNIKVTPLEEYQGYGVSIMHQCICGDSWFVTPANVLNGKLCKKCGVKKCADKRRKTHDDYLKDLEKINATLEPIEEYKGATTAIMHKCKICEAECLMEPTNVLSGKICRDCSYRLRGDNLRKSHEDYVKELSAIRDDLEVLEPYIDYKIPILHKCLKHNYIWPISPLNAIQGNGCPECGSEAHKLARLKTHDEFVDEVADVNPYVKIVGKYAGARENIECSCLMCNYTWSPQASSLVSQKTGCPMCQVSKGEKRIGSYLIKKDVDYIINQTFPNLLGLKGGLLSYDFYLPEYNCLIEYQGEQHESPHTGVFGGEKQFKRQKEHDKRKKQYALDNNIQFIEIWYYDYDNIETILDSKLFNILNSETLTTAGCI